MIEFVKKTNKIEDVFSDSCDPRHIEVPEGFCLDVGYDPESCHEAGEFIFFSDAPLAGLHNTNKRRQIVNPAWGAPYMFGPTVRPQQLPAFQRACTRGNATVLIMGDSIFNAGSDLANPQQNPWEELISCLKKSNPYVCITDHNQTWGMQSWAQMASGNNGPHLPSWIDGKDGKKSWLQTCLDKKPDLVFLYSGGNDLGNLNPEHVDFVVKSFRNINADVVLCETFQPSTGTRINDYWKMEIQDGVHFSRRYITTYAQANNIPYLPFGRWGDMIRDGFDPEILAMPENNPEKNTGYPARYEYIHDNFMADERSKYPFPSVKNMINVSADNCTDWCIGITHDGINEKTKEWAIPLSYATYLGYDNFLRLILDKEFLEFSTSDGAGNKKFYRTGVPVPRGKWSFWIMARGSRVVFSMRMQHNPYGVENSIGLGFTKLLDILIPRSGSPYQPYISAQGEDGVTLGRFCIDSLCSADTTRADGGGLRFRPSVTDSSLYFRTEINKEGKGDEWKPNAGGSDSYHLNNFGLRNLIYPVINAQDFSCSVAVHSRSQSVIYANQISSPDGIVRIDEINAQGAVRTEKFLQSKGAISAWGAAPVQAQPVIKGGSVAQFVHRACRSHSGLCLT